MSYKACVCAGILAAGCTTGVPGGFSNGDRWTFPLVGPLEDGLLMTPVSVRGHGPYLFAIDPDANISVIDQQVADEAGLTMGRGPSRFDETGSEQMRGYAELLDLKVGNLAISRRQVMLVPTGFYNAEGRRLNGVLGRDVLADMLVFGFDRDQGIATLATTKVFVPASDAVAIKYQAVPVDTTTVATGAGGRAMSDTSDSNAASRVGVMTHSDSTTLDVTPISRRVATAQIGDAKLAMHLDLGDPVSQLREALWSKAKLPPSEVKLRMVDEVATVRMVTSAAIAPAVTLGTAKASQVTLAPYVDKRFAIAKLDGTLGLDFFRAYAVYANWGAETFYLKPRGDAAATAVARLGRWGADLPACPHPGCITATLTTTEGGIKLDVARDPQAANHALEIYLGVTPVAGRSVAPLIVELPSGTDTISGGVTPKYEGATLTVLDVSPFTRPCPGDGGCVFSPGGPPAHDAP